MSIVDTRVVDPRVEFWSNEDWWPRDATGVVFLARILHHLGRLIYGKDWTGFEPQTTVIYAICPQHSADTPPRDIDYACHLLFEYHLGYRQRAEQAAAAGEPRPLPTSDEWALARAWSEKIEAETLASLNRYHAVVDVLTRLFEQGIVVTGLRGYEAGSLTRLAPGEWFNECYRAWFATCQIHPESRYSRIPVRCGGCWIYVDLESYTAWLALAFDTVGRTNHSEIPAAEVAAEQTAPRDPTSADKSTAATSKQGSADDAGAERPVAEAQAALASRSSHKQKRKRGARPRYDWPTFKAEVVRRVTDGTAPSAVDAFAKEMADWCVDTWGNEPTNSTLRKYISAALAENGLTLPRKL